MESKKKTRYMKEGIPRKDEQKYGKRESLKKIKKR